MNEVLLIGHAGQDIQVGDKVSTFTLAESYKSKTEEKLTQWHRIKCFGFLKDIDVKKGEQVMVRGKYRSNKYTNKEGVLVESWEVLADNIAIVPRTGTPQPQPQSVGIEEAVVLESGLPF